MKYISTRGEAPVLGFEDVLLAGLARDGGLYVPEAWPTLEPEEIAALAGKPYAEAALAILQPFVGDALAEAELGQVLRTAYAQFRHPAVAPLVQLDANSWVLELFHGPTLAFKDVAMQVLGRLMDGVLQRRGERATIVGATSGDTGGAAIEAFRGRAAIDIFILYPQGRVSEVQRRQMTTLVEPNVHAIAIDGTFDDCQNALKALFNDHALRDELSLAGVNSINWARIAAQVVYYFTSAVALGAPHRPVSFSVPTGNFGDIFAGYVASAMGLPIERLIVATNANDILARTISSGSYRPQGVVATHSPSMDIQISSNFERLLLELAQRRPARVRELMGALARTGQFDLDADEHRRLTGSFSAHSVDERETLAAIAHYDRSCGYLADPHTAVGLAAAAREAAERPTASPIVTLATAHPAKFPAAIRAATGRTAPEPESVTRQRNARERVEALPNDIGVIANHISSRTRAKRATT